MVTDVTEGWETHDHSADDVASGCNHDDTMSMLRWR